MKALLVFAFLLTVSNANAEAQLSCYAEGLSKKETVMLVQNGKDFKITRTTVMDNSEKRVLNTVLYTQGNPVVTTSGYTVYKGLAETQVQVDVFYQEDFTLVVPKSLESRATVTLEADHGDGKEVVEELSFRCSQFYVDHR